MGQLIFGQVVTGADYSWGRSISLEHNISTFETPDKIQYARKISDARRTIEIAWTEGVDISSVMGDNPTPDVWSGSTTAGMEPISSPQDVIVLNRYHEHVLGVLNDDVTISNVIGNENVSDGGEVFRVGTLNIIEVI